MDDRTKQLLRQVQTMRRKVPALSDEPTWRALLDRVTGVQSTRAMTPPMLRAVIGELHKAGVPRLAGKAGGRDRSRFVPSEAMGKARALWIKLADAGVIHDRSEAALSTFVARQTGQDIGVIDQAASRKVVEALKAIAARHGVEYRG